MVVDQRCAGGVDRVEPVGLAAAAAAATHGRHGFDDLVAGRLQHSGQAVSVRADAFDGPEHPLPSGKVLAGPGQQPCIAVRVGADLDLGMNVAEGVDQCGGMGASLCCLTLLRFRCPPDP
jgi:hypothetical protein